MTAPKTTAQDDADDAKAEDDLQTCMGGILDQQTLFGRDEELLRYWIDLGRPCYNDHLLMTKCVVEAWSDLGEYVSICFHRISVSIDDSQT